MDIDHVMYWHHDYITMNVYIIIMVYGWHLYEKEFLP
mgnify:CR=1 FL=1